MATSASAQEGPCVDFIVVPRAICHSCGNASGPLLSLSPLSRSFQFHRTNSFPDTTSLNSALSTIANIDSQISLLDSEITSLQHTLSLLHHRRVVLEKYKTQQQSVFAPIQKLSQDLLLHLFLECQRNLDDGYLTIGKRSCLQTIMQVCTYWRNLAFEFPLLWNRLRIRDLPYDAAEDTQVTMGNFIDEYLNISKAAPLSIQFEGVVAGKCTPLLDPCIRAIARSSHRWERIIVDNSRIFEAAMDYITLDSSVDSIRSLDISGISRSISFPPTPYLTHITVGKLRGINSQISFTSIPQLTHNSLHGTIHPLTFLPNIPWAQITHFKCRISEDISPLLDLMPELISLELIGHTKISESATLPHLQELTISSYMTLEHALDVWNTPGLRVLNLEEHVEFEKVVAFLGRSRCTLRELTYTSTTPVGEGWKSAEFKQLTSLTLRQPTVDDIRVLTPGDSMTVFPSLDQLSLRYTNLTGNVPKELISMLIS